MADLVTHLCTALLPGAFLGGRYLGAVVLGTALPDLVSRVPPLALELLDRRGLVDVPETALLPWGVLHEPISLVMSCALVSLAVVRRDRGRVLLGLLAGCALHLGLDVLQDHHGEGYFLLAPCSLERYELGLIGSEATVKIAIPLAIVTALAWAWRLRRQRSAPPGDGGR